MTRDLNDWRAERARIHTEMRAMLDAVEVDLEGEDLARYTNLEAEYDRVGARIKREEKLLQVQRDLAASTALMGPREDGNEDDETGKPFRATKRYSNGFWAMARRGTNRLPPDIANALEEGTNSEGGYIVPVEFETQLIIALQNYNDLRQWCNVITTASERRIPVESDDGVATWTDEEAAYTESDVVFGQVILNAYKLGRIIKVSEELLRDAFFDLPSYIANVFGRTFGYAEEAAFVAGDGSAKPSGIVPNAAAGVTAASATAITSDEVIDLYHSLKRPYRRMAVWLMQDLTLKLVRKLKTTEGQYLWQPGLQADEPDTILGRPVLVSDSVPAATAGLKSIAFGDLSYYTVADRAGREMQRLNELYAATGQVGFRMNERLDGKLTLAEAVKVLMMGA